MSTLDLNSGKGKIEWKSDESGAEEASRLRKEESQHQHDLKVSWWTFVAYVVALFVVGIVGLLLIFIGGTPERERTGVVFLTAIISGAVGYLRETLIYSSPRPAARSETIPLTLNS